MASSSGSGLTLAESGALALADAALALDHAADTAAFLRALEHNRKVWQTLKAVAERENWLVPSRDHTAYALSTAGSQGSVNDDHVLALISMNHRVSAELAGGSIDCIRQRAYSIWESCGRPQGQALDHWLIAEMELKGRAG